MLAGWCFGQRSVVAMLLAIYALVPVGPTTLTDVSVRLAGVLGFVVLVIAMQAHAIRTANYPVRPPRSSLTRLQCS